jgi:hypothetical protein
VKSGPGLRPNAVDGVEQPGAFEEICATRNCAGPARMMWRSLALCPVELVNVKGVMTSNWVGGGVEGGVGVGVGVGDAHPRADCFAAPCADLLFACCAPFEEAGFGQPPLSAEASRPDAAIAPSTTPTYRINTMPRLCFIPVAP